MVYSDYHVKCCGRVWLHLLAPRNYSLSTSGAGFKAILETSSMSVRATSTVNIKLDVAATGKTVEVGAAPLLQTDSSEIATTMNTLAVQAVPNPGNDLTFIAQTAPGATMNTQAGVGSCSSFGSKAVNNLVASATYYGSNFVVNAIAQLVEER